MISTLSSPLNVSVPAAAAYNRSHTLMATCSQSTLTVWEGGSGDPLWMPLANWDTAQPALTNVEWAPPEHGDMVAAGAADGSVTVWEAAPGKRWKRLASLQSGRRSVTAMQFAPKQHGLLLAVASCDGYVRLYRADDVGGSLVWEEDNDFRACVNGECTALAWRPDPADLQPLLLTGSDRGAEVWRYRSGLGRWVPAAKLGPQERVTCVHWACTMGRSVELVAVGADSHVTVFSLQGAADAPQVEEVAVLEMGAPVWRVEWNLLGTWLAASCTDAAVQLWRANLVGEWSCIQRIVGTESGGAMGA